MIKEYITSADNKSNYDLICEIYTILKKQYRNEYYYKNILFNKLLLGVHSLNTTTALTELPIADCKADFILINGKAVVYEIKTELDNFDRLENQINNYYKAFDHVAVVTCKESLNDLKEKIESFTISRWVFMSCRDEGQLRRCKTRNIYGRFKFRSSV